MANQVTLTFAGDEQSLVSSFDRVGGAARSMERDVESAASGFDRVGEAADSVDTRAMGFRDTLTGVQDGMEGLKVAQDGIGFEALLLMGFAIGDLSSGLYNFLVPAMKSAVGWLAQTRVGMLTAAAAQKVWTAAQWLFNASLLASPITWIVVGIVALVAVIVVIAAKTDWFQRAWRASWSWIKDAAANAWDFIKRIPGWTGDAFAKVAGFITRPYRAAFNAVARAWNSTVGRLSWTVPSWVPGVGGRSVSVPNLPTFHAGGRVPGAPGQDVLAVLQAGETVTSAAGRAGTTLTIDSAGARLDDLLVEVLRRAITVRGGNVQTVLGR